MESEAKDPQTGYILNYYTLCKVYCRKYQLQFKYENCLENPQTLEILRGLIVTVTNALFSPEKKGKKNRFPGKKNGQISAQALRPPIDL